MISNYRIHENGTDKRGYNIGYIERSDNYLFIASGIILSYDMWLSITDFERSPDYRIVNMYRNEDGSIILLCTNDLSKEQYIVKQPI